VSARILIVDDDAALLDALPKALRLRMDGIEIDTSETAIDALERIRETDYDAIVSDIKMPGMDGLELCRRIRSNPAHKRLPILILTSAEHSSEVGDVVGLGLIWYMRKGAEWATVLRSLRNLAARGEDLQAAV